jgi:serine/threonine protein phosphatase PrpC
MVACSLVDWHVAARSLESESGDQYLVREMPSRVLVAVVDGLGHGPEAAAAAKAAVAVLDGCDDASLARLVTRCHENLRGTRGAVLSLASIEPGNLTWLGVGNVDGVLLRSGFGPPDHLLVRGGVVGHRLPSLDVSRTPLGRGDTLVLATDGVHRRFVERPEVVYSAPPTAERILTDFGKDTDDALVMVVRYLGTRQ